MTVMKINALFKPIRPTIILAFSLIIIASGNVNAGTSANGLRVSMPNGYANVNVTDMAVESLGGQVKWQRWWDGETWKFNPHWESLSQTWSNVTCNTSLSIGVASSSSGSANVDSRSISIALPPDSSTPPPPTIGHVDPTAVPHSAPAGESANAQLTLPFNQAMSDTPPDNNFFGISSGGGGGSSTGSINPSTPTTNTTDGYPPLSIVDLAASSGCFSSIASVGSMEGIRRQHELYIGQNGKYTYKYATAIEKHAVKGLPQTDAGILNAQLATGHLTIAPVNIPKGFRWQHKEGDWIEYNLHGQMLAYGDANNNTTWLVRDSSGTLRGVVDGNGHVLFAFEYTNGLLSKVTDFPLADIALDLPSRSVNYTYDAYNRLVKVTDVRGNSTRYDYNSKNQLTFITDGEGRHEQLAYTDKAVAEHEAADGGITTYTVGFDEANQQYTSKIRHPATSAGQRVDDLTHNSEGKLTKRIVNGRDDLTVTYGVGSRSEDRGETRTNARGFSTGISRNEFEQITRVQYADGSSRSRSYSGLNMRLTESVDEVGIRTLLEYDAKGNLLKTTEAAGTPDERITEYQVNGLGLTTQITRKGRTEGSGKVTPDAVWLIEYDDLGQIKKTTDPEGGIRQYVFDRAGNVAQYTDPLNHATRYEVDNDGNLLKITDAEGRITAYSYDKVGNALTATDARGKQAQAGYDAMNRLLKVTNASGGIAQLSYDAEGLPTQVLDEAGRKLTFEFDTFQRLAQLSDGLDNKTQFGYNTTDGAAANVLGSVSIPTEIKFPTFTQKLKLDARERVTDQTLLNPNSDHTATDTITTGNTYDSLGRLKTEKDPDGNIRSYTYNAFGQITQMVDNLGNTTTAFYDARGNLVQLTDANGNSHKFEYDKNDRLTKETLPLGQITAYSYDAAGNVSERTDANGNKTVYSYDKTDWLTEVKHYNATNQHIRTTGFTWDANQNLTAWTDTDLTRPDGQQTASSEITYDDDDRKLNETIHYPTPNGAAYSLSYGYQYNAAGDKTQLTWADGTALQYGYSQHGELKTVTIPNEGIISVGDYNWVSPKTVTLPGGATQNKAYDGVQNLTNLKVKTVSQQPLLELTNSYSKRLELSARSRIDTLLGQTLQAHTDFTYDKESRLTKTVTDTTGNLLLDTESFTLDALGNRIEHSQTLGGLTYDGNNRLLEKGALLDKTTYTYDDNGNLLQKTQGGTSTTYLYDSQNRLIEVQDSQHNPIARYGYDPFDRRLWKEVYRSKDGALLTQAQRSYYLYAEEGLIAESQQAISHNNGQAVSATAAPAIVNQYGPRPNNPYTTGVLFVKTLNSNNQSVYAYYHHDHMNTPIQATDKYGKVVWAGRYSAFGQVTDITPTATGDNPVIESSLRFPGQIEDSETGLYYNWRRYYDPEVGRYVTQDPIGLDGGMNLYSYVGGDPINSDDPSGEIAPIAYCLLNPVCRTAAQAVVQFLRCFGSCMVEDTAEQAWEGECIDLEGNAKNCAKQCVNPLNWGGKGKFGIKGKKFPEKPVDRSRAKRRAAREAQRKHGTPTSRPGTNQQGRPGTPRHQTKEGADGKQDGIVDGSNDRVEGHEPHIEVGDVKEGEPINKHGQPRLQNGKSKENISNHYEDE